MKKDIYNFDNYKAYLRFWMAQKPGHGRGYLSRMAEAVGCQTGYASQVLNGSANFSLEQGEELNKFLGHTYEEGHFFLLLIEVARAGSEKLRKRFKTEIEKVLRQRSVLKERLGIKESLELQDQITYYSSWHYAAIHVAISVPELQTRESLGRYFQLPFEVLDEVLEFLIRVGLIQKQGDRFTQGVTRLFLGKDSPMIKKLHTNWRLQAVRSIENGKDRDLHFSNVVSLSKKDFLVVKEQLIKSIEDVRAVTRPSKEEEVCCINIDFFHLGS